MPESAKEAAIKEFGSVEQWKAHYMERASQETMQRGYQKLVEWYGSKEAALDAAMAPPNQELVQACQKRLDAVLEKLNEKRKRGCPLDSFEVRESVGEYEFVMKRLYQMEAKEGLEQLMLSVADSYRHEMVRPKTDAQYGRVQRSFSPRRLRHSIREPNLKVKKGNRKRKEKEQVDYDLLLFSCCKRFLFNLVTCIDKGKFHAIIYMTKRI